MMDKMKAYICTRCGGSVNRVTHTCEYCGTKYKEDNHIPNMVQMVVDRPGVQVLGVTRSIDWETKRYVRDPHIMSEMVMKDICNELSRCIAPFLEVITEEDPMRMRTNVMAKLRVVDKNHVFH